MLKCWIGLGHLIALGLRAHVVEGALDVGELAEAHVFEHHGVHIVSFDGDVLFEVIDYFDSKSRSDPFSCVGCFCRFFRFEHQRPRCSGWSEADGEAVHHCPFLFDRCAHRIRSE